MKGSNSWYRKALSVAVLVACLATVGLNAFAATKQAPSSPVDINKASVEELSNIPGIGQAKAQAIVAKRTAKPFASTEELIDVKGIGEKLYAKMAPYVTVGGATNARPGTAENSVR